MHRIVKKALFRKEQLEKRPKAVEEAKKDFRRIQLKLERIKKSKPWLPEEKLTKIKESMDNYDKWLSKKLKFQKKLDNFEDPSFTVKEIQAKINILKKLWKKLNKLAKPKDKSEYKKKPKKGKKGKKK